MSEKRTEGLGRTVVTRRTRKPEITREALNAAIEEYLAMGGGITKIKRTDVINASSKAYPENYHKENSDESDTEQIGLGVSEYL